MKSYVAENAALSLRPQAAFSRPHSFSLYVHPSQQVTDMYTTREHYITILGHAIDNKVVNTINMTYSRTQREGWV